MGRSNFDLAADTAIPEDTRLWILAQRASLLEAGLKRVYGLDVTEIRDLEDLIGAFRKAAGNPDGFRLVSP